MTFGGGCRRRPNRLSVALAGVLLDAARAHRTRQVTRQRRRLRRLLAHEGGTQLSFSLADRVLRPVSPEASAAQLSAIAAGDLSPFLPLDRVLLRMGTALAGVLPRPVVALAKARILSEATPFVAPLEPGELGRGLEEFRRARRRPNLNILGEAILGWGEAERRRGGVEELLRRADVDCVSVKMSSIAPGISLLDFEGSLQRAAEPLRRLYRVAAATRPHKLVNLDMEEHRDLELTIELFTRVLGEPEFASLSAGIAIQAYVPDSHAQLDQLLAWARARRRAGGAPIRIRLVKGANLAMEKVDAEVHGWQAPTYPTKEDTDASYKRLLDQLIAAASTGDVAVGVASHNLFDLAYALCLAERLRGSIEIEMLTGMADDQAAAVADRTGQLLLYVPLAARSDFHNALAYLARRLDENATPDGFLRRALDLTPRTEAWDEEVRRFTEAMKRRYDVPTTRRQTQDRATGHSPVASSAGLPIEPDTDLTVSANRTWALDALRALPEAAPAAASVADVDAAVARSVAALENWRHVPIEQRRAMLLAAAECLAGGRQEAITVMAHETGKTFAEADPEVSEAVDYARWYAQATELLGRLEATTLSEPLGVVVVASPWNFPFAIPAGGVLAALAAANTVILKPSPEARATAKVLIDQIRRAGFDPDCVQLVAANDDDAGKRLITHPDVAGIVLTGSWETARELCRLGARQAGPRRNKWEERDCRLVERRRRPGGPRSRAIGVRPRRTEVLGSQPRDRGRFDPRSQSVSPTVGGCDASLRVGEASDEATEVGPLVGPMTPALQRALTKLDDNEHWLVEPRQVAERLWSPGVRVGVQPGSWAHRTEWFGPVLGVIRVDDLDEALQCQNAVDFGLTAGLHSLDPAEQRRWIDAVEAGNLYLNRHTTGAIVGRQPFGGWKASSFGPTAKTGGPNYLLSLRRWSDAHITRPRTRDSQLRDCDARALLEGLRARRLAKRVERAALPTHPPRGERALRERRFQRRAAKGRCCRGTHRHAGPLLEPDRSSRARRHRPVRDRERRDLRRGDPHTISRPSPPTARGARKGSRRSGRPRRGERPRRTDKRGRSPRTRSLDARAVHQPESPSLRQRGLPALFLRMRGPHTTRR